LNLRLCGTEIDIHDAGIGDKDVKIGSCDAESIHCDREIDTFDAEIGDGDVELGSCDAESGKENSVYSAGQ
jgi:hypothetical protein